MTGHIRKRPTKDGKPSYQIILEGEKDPINGKRQRIYKTVNGTKKEAEATLNKMLYEHNTSGTITKPSAMKLSDWLKEWQELYTTNLSPTTKTGYRKQINTHIIPALGNIPVSNLTAHDVQAWVNSLSAKGLSAKTVKNIFLNLSGPLDRARKLRMIQYSPCEDIVLPSVKKFNVMVYTKAEVKNILSLVKNTDMYLLLSIEFSIGLRLGEITELKWSDIDLEKGIVHITRSKVDADGERFVKPPKSEAGIRDIYIGDKLLKLLKEEYTKYLEKTKKVGFKKTEYVICKKDGEGYVPRSIAQKWTRFCKKNKIRVIRFHDLRHTCATLMIAGGASPATVQAILGHSDVQITLNTYTHPLPAMIQSASNIMNNLLI